MLEPTTVKSVRTNIGKLIKLLRKQDRLTQEQLAERLGLSRMTIKNIEAGQNATLETLFKILKHFDILENFAGLINDEISNRQYDSLY